MAKQKKKKSQRNVEVRSTGSGSSFLERLERPKLILAFFILLFIVMALLYKPLVIGGLEPSGGDFVSNIGTTHQIITWKEKTNHLPLWNPYMFGGMPIYQHLSSQVWAIDKFLTQLDFLIDWRIWYFLAGAIGIFLLVKYLGLLSATAMLAAIGFVMMPHFQALIIVGHFAKFRALMWMPYVVLTFLFLVRDRSLLSGALFALAFAVQFRTKHYQIIFYTLMVLLFLGIPVLYHYLKNKNWQAIFRSFALLITAFILSLLVSAQNFLTIREYTPHSTRGGYALSIDQNAETKKEEKGVGFDYATTWSYSLSEFWNLIVPKFHGGTSNEMYTGDAVPSLRNRELPTYWGTMPFTQSYEYMGILLVFLAFIGVVFQWNRWEVKSLTILTVVALVMSLGKNFPLLYKIFFYYVPYFDKFRAPVMILTMVMFNLSILAAMGLSFLLTTDLTQKDISQRFYVLGGIFVTILMIPLFFGSTFSLTHAGEAERYGQEIVNMFKKIRLEMLRQSTLKSTIFLLIGIGGIFAFQKSWFKRDTIFIILILVVTTDLILLNHHYLKGKFIDQEIIEKQKYQPNAIDKEIKEDIIIHRVFPVGQLFSDVHWVYHHQSIGGYSPAKLQVIQEIIENSLYVRLQGSLPINWNVVDLLNVKYLIAKQQLKSPHLLPLVSIPDISLFSYRNLNFMPRAFFVNHHEVITDGVERLKRLNSPDFNPRETALLEQQLPGEVHAPDSSFVEVAQFTPEKISLRVYTNKRSLLVVSEIFYDPGWSAILDGKEEIKIYKTDHLIRSVIIPAGNHELSFTFHPNTYYAGMKISLISVLLVHFLILLLLFVKYRSRLPQILRGKSSSGSH